MFRTRGEGRKPHAARRMEETPPATQARNGQNIRSFGKILAGNPTRPPAPIAAGFRLKV